ncbi:MAG: S8 family serine peptidase [Bacteroidales bacterium]|nr:S8 family serine peptidase [Bacteroidales bacterium]
MKRFFVFLVLLMSFSTVFAQTRVIVVMADNYDDAQLARKTQNMTKAQRRDFVIQERMAFCRESQQNVMDFLDGLKGDVSGIEQYWAFNGFSCDASENVVAQLEKRPDVAYVYRDQMRKMVPDMVEAKVAETRDIAWHVNKVNAPAVWSYNGSTGYNGDGVVVAVVDSGVDYNHVDIAGSMWNGGPEFPHHGYDCVNNDNDPMDEYCHGTHVAGIIAGQGNAGTQTGIAPGAKIMAVRVLDDTGYGSDAQVIDGLQFALEHGADILNLSLGDPEVGPVALYRDLFKTIQDAGVVASVAAGNVGDTQYSYPVPFNVECPGNCPPPWLHPDQVNLISGGTTAVICVGATDANDAHCGFSSVGPVTWAAGAQVGDYNDYPYQNGDASQPGLIRPDISAPGANVTSLNYQTGTGYVAYDGTSMATPCVAGVLALLLDADPELLPAELDSIIELTAANAGNTVKNNITGSGRVDALAAVNALFFHGPTNLTAYLSGDYVDLNWTAAANATSYSVYRDGIVVANNLTSTTYTDQLTYAGKYTYYVKAHLNNDLTTLPSNYVHIEKVIDIQTEVINQTKVALSWDMPNCIYDGFESGNLYQNMWINDGVCPWEVTNADAHSGSYSVRSTNKTMFSTSKISLAVNVATTCVVSYYAKISCFPLNGGGFFIDNVQYGETLKDIVPWTRYTVTLSPGNHLLEWKYGNQLTEGDYENSFYIDDITVGNAYDIYRANCDGSGQTMIAEAVINAQFIDNDWVTLPIGQYKYGVSIDGGYTIYWSDCIDKDYQGLDENFVDDLTIYPNPVNDYIHVETMYSSSVQRIDIYNVTGQIVLSSTDTEINVSELESGIYFVNILTEKGSVTKKISVVR